MDVGVKVHSYHTDNGIYHSDEFLKELQSKGQGIKMSGVSAQFQNGAAESIIKSVVQSARTMMLHANLRWPEVADESLWPHALQYAVYLHNIMPFEESGVSPTEVWSRTKSNHHDLLHTHTWGCPAYVLSPRLREGGNVPKWDPRSKRGQFVGYSPLHASSVGMIRNLNTHYVSPQFHVMYDDFFETVHSTEGSPPSPEIWERLYTFNRSQVDWDIEPPDLAVEWLSPGERHARRAKQQENHRGPTVPRGSSAQREPDGTTEGATPAISQEDVQAPLVEEAPAPSPQQPPAQAASPAGTSPSPATTRQSTRSTRGVAPQRLTYEVRGQPSAYFLVECFHKMIAGLVASVDQGEHQQREFLAMMSSTDGTIETWPRSLREYPMAFKAGNKQDPDSPNFMEAVTGEHGEQYRHAMDSEMTSLKKATTWNLMPRSQVPRGANILPLTWVYKLKRYPDGRPRKFKARLCVRGDKQVEGIDYTDKYAPVVNWSTVRLLMILTVREKLYTRLVDFTNAFAQANLKEAVYCELPRLYESRDGSDTVLKLNKSLYGLVQAPLCWYKHLRDGLIAEGFTPSELDPCLYYGHGMAVLTYVDDCIFFGKDLKKIDAIIARLKKKFDLTVEEAQGQDQDVFAYLGVEVQVNKTTGEMTFLQKGLIDKVLRTTGMQDCNAKPTPACTTPLGTDADGPRCQQSWDYASVIGMLMYLTSNSRPDIQYAVHQCARFTHNPRASHEQAILRICRYLKGTQDQGLVFKPQAELALDCYVDADFAGLWKVENELDPVCVKSRTGYVLMLGGCPLTWASRLQSEIALSTTEAEYIALSTAMRDLLPTRALLKEVGKNLQLSYCNKSTILSRVWEDNNGAIRLAEATNKITFRTKHIAVKYHFFREHLSDEIQVKKVDTTNQLADIFTKGLAAYQFHKLASRLMGWANGGDDGDEDSETEIREHSSGRETRRMRGSDAGHASGQGLTSGQDDGQGLLSRQAKSNVIRPLRRVTWLDPIDDGRLVRESVASWDRARLRASQQRQQRQQHNRRQATATRNGTQATQRVPNMSGN